MQHQHTLHDVIRFARNNETMSENGQKRYSPVIGEEAALLTTFTAFAMAQRPTVVNAFSGTGKTTIADAVVGLIPENQLMVIDMMSAQAIWYAHERINAKRFLLFPELQNAGDNGEIVKIQKKLGEGKSAEREVTGNVLADGINRRENRYVIEWHPTLTTMATGNKVGEQVFDEEQQRRCVIVSTDPSAKQTRAVMKAQAAQFARGVQRVVTMTDAEKMSLRMHVAGCIKRYGDIRETLVPGLEAFVEKHAPDVFTASRSALPMLTHVVKGTALFYHKSETIRDGTLIVSPARFAEALEFYGPTFFANCMKLPPMGREVLTAFPALRYAEGTAVHHASMMSEDDITKALTKIGLTVEKKKLKTVIERLCDSDFLKLNEELDGKRYHRTALASYNAEIEWGAILDDARRVAGEVLGNDADEWVKRFAGGKQVTYVSPISGQTVTTGASK